ncbi:hypothetical protein OsI_16947 [Oryza sativa Indica Group]|uniref:Uncharacterized protein n=1 Tax=Oryza sativa subsp. indica TaxID=39946 RepID=A2XWB9_ORYSI|nr:hypothetical protein OsI_16947 [Oryza sativa Indica Group]
MVAEPKQPSYLTQASFPMEKKDLGLGEAADDVKGEDRGGEIEVDSDANSDDRIKQEKSREGIDPGC